MNLQLQSIDDKIEFFEATSLQALEKKIEEQIINNQALLLRVKSVSHSVYLHPQTSQPMYTAVVHFYNGK